MNRKLSRAVLLIAMIVISTFIGGIFVINLTNPSIRVNYAISSNSDNDELNKVILQNYSRRGIEEIDDIACCMHTDVTAPSVNCVPYNNSIVLAGTTIDLTVWDDNPFYSNIAERIFYHWNKDQSNTTIENTEGKYAFKIAVPDNNGTNILYFYAEDSFFNFASFRYIFEVFAAGDPPTIDFIDPSASDETLTGMYVFRVNVTDDFGPIDAKIQIDSGAKLAMDYNETSGYYYRSYNVSELTNGFHWLNVIAVDSMNTVTDKIRLNIVGGQETVVVSDPPEWDPSKSDLPENLSASIKAGNFLDYNAESGEISFKVAIKDDKGVAAVDFTVYTIDNFDNSTGEFDKSDTELAPQSLSKSGSDGTWDIYQYTWDSTTSSDNYYLCEFEVQDTDEVANRMFIRILLEIDNVEDIETGFPTDGESSTGLLLIPGVLALIGSARIIIWRRRNHKT